MKVNYNARTEYRTMKKVIRNEDEVYGLAVHLVEYLGNSRDGIIVEYRCRVPERTLRQNRYYWGVVLKIIALETGENDIERLHEQMKYKFLKRRDGDKVWVGSTKELSTAEFTDYIEAIRKWALEYLDIQVPDAGEVDDREFHSKYII